MISQYMVFTTITALLERSSISHIRHIQIYCRAYVRIYQLKIKSGEEQLDFMGMLFTLPIH